MLLKPTEKIVPTIDCTTNITSTKIAFEISTISCLETRLSKTSYHIERPVN